MLDHLAGGGRILCYGTLRGASPAWLAALGLAADAEPLDGEFEIEGDIGEAARTECAPHRYNPPTGGASSPSEPPLSRRYLHDAIIGQGGLVETAAGATVLTEAVQAADLPPEGRLKGGGGRRVLAAVSRRLRVLAAVNGRAAWTRGGTGAAREQLRFRRVDARDEREWFAPERLYNVALGALGWFVRMEHGFGPESVEFLVSRNRGGFVFTGHSFDDDAALLVRAPWGAPVPLARRVRLADGAARIPVRGWFHDEARVFVRQREGVVSCRSQPPIAKDLHRRWLVEGLDRADVRFYVQPGRETVYYAAAATEYGDAREPVRPDLRSDGTGVWFELRDWTGPLSIGWS